MEGWIKLHRKLLDNPISNKPAYLSVWVHLLLLANHEEKDFIYKNEKYTCKRGQIITSRAKLSERTGLAASTVEGILKYLEKEGNIRQQGNSSFRVITVTNYNEYQEIRQPAGQRADSQPDTNKNVKNERKKYMPSGTLLKEYQGVAADLYEKLGKPEGKENEIVRLVKEYGNNKAYVAYDQAKDIPTADFKWKMFCMKLQTFPKQDKNATLPL